MDNRCPKSVSLRKLNYENKIILKSDSYFFCVLPASCLYYNMCVACVFVHVFPDEVECKKSQLMEMQESWQSLQSEIEHELH